MPFFAKSFQYNGIPSENFGLYITSGLSGSPDTSSPMGSDVKLYTEQLYRRPTVFLYGVQQTPQLSIPISFTSEGELTAADAQIAGHYLFGQQTFKKLQVIQEDMIDIYINCFFTKPEILRSGNIIMGFNATLVADSPWWFTYPRNFIKNYTGDVTTNTFIFNNTTDNNFYTYPTLILTTSNVGNSDMIIINQSDNNRTSILTNLDANEIITLNNDLQIIESSFLDNHLQYFNKNWFRLVQGVNQINIQASNIAQFKMVYQFARKIGG